MPDRKILILGGTGDAVELAGLLEEAGYRTVLSLAGVTRMPRLPAGEVRVGSLGGAAGLAAMLGSEGFDAIIDATHPFAAVISASASWAAAQTGLPHVRLERPAWTASPADQWILAASTAEAVSILPPQARVFLTIGRKELQAFMARDDITGIARMIEPPDLDLRSGWELILSRPPHALEDEMALMRLHRITHLVSKNAGGAATEAKLQAAARLSLPVVMIERPARPAAETFADAESVRFRLDKIFCS